MKKVSSSPSIIPKGIKFLDYGGVLEQLNIAFRSDSFVLLIGEKGTGKTTSIAKWAEKMGKKIYSINCSLRTREHNIIGRWEIRNNESIFVEGVLPKSMREGEILYIDEINQAEPDTLIRLSESLDDRRQLIYDGEVIKAAPGWFVIASINPLKYVGTKELPPQILSRLPNRIYIKSPSHEQEVEIIQIHTGEGNKNIVDKVVQIAQKLRETELLYTPSIRESITAVKMVQSGMELKDAVLLTMVNSLWQYGESEVRKAKELIYSLGVLGEIEW